LKLKYALLVVSTPLLSLFSCQKNNTDEIEIVASATLEMVMLNEDLSYQVTDTEIGIIRFKQKEDVVSIDLEVTNFPEGQLSYYHAIHIHNGTCESPLSHWNLGKDLDYNFCNVLSMDEVWAKPKAGDLGNVFINEAGMGDFSLQTDLYTVGSNDASDIVGKIIYIHEVAENFSQECFEGHNHNHNNKKIACGTIELSN
jgi:Cu-Zn family superoxide dismutase|tara:strand:+ start:801 stop:1397 length:597 start_codon:yes stop_codon:yes gene_type:complete